MTELKIESFVNKIEEQSIKDGLAAVTIKIVNPDTVLTKIDVGDADIWKLSVTIEGPTTTQPVVAVTGTTKALFGIEVKVKKNSEHTPKLKLGVPVGTIDLGTDMVPPVVCAGENFKAADFLVSCSGGKGNVIMEVDHFLLEEILKIIPKFGLASDNRIIPVVNKTASLLSVADTNLNVKLPEDVVYGWKLLPIAIPGTTIRSDVLINEEYEIYAVTSFCGLYKIFSYESMKRLLGEARAFYTQGDSAFGHADSASLLFGVTVG